MIVITLTIHEHPAPGRNPITIEEFDAIYSDHDTCPIHDFTRPCPSCEMVAITAGVTTDVRECKKCRW